MSSDTKRFGVISSKGGTGKTTTIANLGGILADLGLRTLLVDTDHQGSLSRYYPISKAASAGITQMIQRADATGCIGHTSIKNLDIVVNDDPKGDRGGLIIPFLQESTGHVLHLNYALDKLNGAYDVVLMDTRGASGIVQESVILAATELLSPVAPNYLDAREFVSDTVGILMRLAPAHGMPCINGRPLAQLKAVINKRERTNANTRIVQWLHEQFEVSDGQVCVLATEIPKLSIYNESVGVAEPAHRLEIRRRGRTPSAHETLLALAYELIPEIQGRVPHWDEQADTKEAQHG